MNNATSITAEPQTTVAPQQPPPFEEQWIVQYQCWLQHGVNKWATLVYAFNTEPEADAYIARNPERTARKVRVPAQ